MSKRRALSLLPSRRGDPRASVAAFALQCFILFIVAPSFLVPVALEILRDDSGRTVMPDRITYITAVPKSETPTRVPARAGGDGREESKTPTVPAAPIVAPSEVPTGVAPSTTPARDPEAGIGPLVGGGGPTKGVRPSFSDPRLWVSPTGDVEAPMIPLTRADSLQMVLNAYANAYVDSMRRATPQGGRAPGDWTFQKNGKTYGIDPKFIRLGDFSIPTAVLALLPMNQQGNPIAMERARRINSMRTEIQEQADRRQRDDDFYSAVRALRERKERERREAQKAAENKSPTSARP